VSRPFGRVEFSSLGDFCLIGLGKEQCTAGKTDADHSASSTDKTGILMSICPDRYNRGGTSEAQTKGIFMYMYDFPDRSRSKNLTSLIAKIRDSGFNVVLPFVIHAGGLADY